MDIETDRSLAGLNSFGFAGRAEHFASVSTDAELEEVIAVARQRRWPVFVLGGGTNLVLARDLAGLVVQLQQQYIHYDDARRSVTAGAGLDWHSLVLDTLAHDRPGLENLSLIPGSVGAAPVQNIGAYGVELAERFVRCRALHLPSGEWLEFDRQACDFDYRHSLFKQHAGEYAITELTLEVGHHLPLVTGYTSLRQCLEANGSGTIDARTVSDCVIRIRRQKLPDPDRLGNAGSFFKNPLVERADFARLQERYPAIVGYPQNERQVKLAAGWLIDSLGLKGYRRGAVGVHTEQALVLVNHGGGSGVQLLALADEISAAVQDRYGVTLQIEPVVID